SLEHQRVRRVAGERELVERIDDEQEPHVTDGTIDARWARCARWRRLGARSRSPDAASTSLPPIAMAAAAAIRSSATAATHPAMTAPSPMAAPPRYARSCPLACATGSRARRSTHAG